MSEKEWNPRFLAYCRDTGEPDPERALARDDEAYPGGKMAGFQRWVDHRWAEWCASKGWKWGGGRINKEGAPRWYDHPPSLLEHDEFDQWLRCRTAG